MFKIADSMGHLKADEANESDFTRHQKLGRGASGANFFASVGVSIIDMGAHGGRAHGLECINSLEPKNALRGVLSIFGK
ncbi:hypothetical protein EAS61_40605 [Bradyrhizobium zhanjiangense]|uniref:Uncharacterized protein n=1 Tax=Bradyrhizobium zhanjiangense TaxID=1325107 RepID=A0A4Q0Q4I6_9BRAD|nr:hypothetical protein EAS61_40605 [Bradyrhizobium zhanjiangense]